MLGTAVKIHATLKWMEVLKLNVSHLSSRSLEWRLKDSSCLDLLGSLHQVRLCLCCNICKMEITLPATYLREP